jgi:hypothetical protein
MYSLLSYSNWLSNGILELQGEVWITSVEGLHQIHLFIFVLAIVHVCATAVPLSFLVSCRWHWKFPTRIFPCAFWFPYSAFYVILSHNAQHPEGSKLFSPGSIHSPLIMNTEIFSISYERNLYPGWLLVQSCYSTSFVRHICIVSSWEPPISSFWDFLLLHFSSGR